MSYALRPIPKAASPSVNLEDAAERGRLVVSELTELFQRYKLHAELRIGMTHGKLTRNAVEGTVFSDGFLFSAQFRVNTQASSGWVSIDTGNMEIKALGALSRFSEALRRTTEDPQFREILRY